MHVKVEATPGGKFQRALEHILFWIPFALLGLMALTWLRIGIDLPFHDDWRDYANGTKGSLAPGYLFKSANDTLYPVGKFLDSLAERLLDGNTIAYQFISMVTVLGLILWFQWLLLSQLARDRFFAACCFAATVFALQAGSYWGIQNLAYHQAIPLVCMLIAAYLVNNQHKIGKPTLLVLFLLGLIAGFSYISGAIPFLVGAFVLIGLGLALPARRDLIASGTALGLASAISSAAQGYVIMVLQGGRTHRSDAPWVTPLSPDFWLYFLGKIGRSLALPAHQPALSLAVTVLVVAGTLFLIGRELFRTFGRREMTDIDVGRLVVMLYLGSITAVYLAMVSAGRSNLGISAEATYLDKFAYGFPRFHYYWVTTIWPWAILLLVCWISERFSKPVGKVLAGGIIAAILISTACAGSFDYRRYFQYTSTFVRGEHGIACIQKQLLTSDRINCPRIAQSDLTSAYAFAVRQGTSFVRNAPPTLAQFNPSPARKLFTLAETSLEAVTINNAVKVEPAGPVVNIEAADDLQMILPASETAEKCHTVLLRAVVDGAESKVAEFFYTPAGSRGYSGKNRVIGRYFQGTVEMIASSATGFESQFRFDPITLAASINVKELTVHCLVFRK